MQTGLTAQIIGDLQMVIVFFLVSRRSMSGCKIQHQAGFRALAAATAKVTWLQHLLKELYVSLHQAPTLWCDNLSATYLIVNPIFHASNQTYWIEFSFCSWESSIERLGSLLHQFFKSVSKHLSLESLYSTTPLYSISIYWWITRSLNIIKFYHIHKISTYVYYMGTI